MGQDGESGRVDVVDITLDATAMHLVLLLLIVLAPSLGCLALLGHRTASGLQLSRYAALSLAAWFAASLGLFALVLQFPGGPGSAFTVGGGTSGFQRSLRSAFCLLPWSAPFSIAGCALVTRTPLSHRPGSQRRRGGACGATSTGFQLRIPRQLLVRVASNPSIERTSQRPLRALWPAAHVER
jgi:hypothetical protein